MNFFWLLAEEVREYMAKLGYRSVEEMVGQTQRLSVNDSNLHYKSEGLDLRALLTPAMELKPDNMGVTHNMNQNHELDAKIDNELIAEAAPALERGEPVDIFKICDNEQRSLGTMLSYEVSTKYGKEGLPEDTIKIKLAGHGGQSLGFTLAKGVSIKVEGDANDGIGKCLSGGKISVAPSSKVTDFFRNDEHVIVGNACLYGASRGKAFFSGKAGERFAVRNSGALSVVEGVGDHGCE